MNKRDGWTANLFLIIQVYLISNLLFPNTAFAYVDPGSGSVIVTTILGFIAAIGYTFRKYFYKIKRMISRNKIEKEEQQDKYSFIQEPINRLITASPRHGAKLINGLVYSSQVPTSREFVNMIGAGIDTLYIGDPHSARDDDGFKAMEQLQDKNVITVLPIS